MRKILEETKFEISNKIKTNLSIDRLVFAKMKESLLGEDYDLSLALVGKNEIKKLNKSYRGVNETTDILSFSLSDNEGEIFICPEIARKKAYYFDRSYDNFIKYLFIHALVHLKGFEHGSRMESEEKKIRKKFGV